MTHDGATRGKMLALAFGRFQSSANRIRRLIARIESATANDKGEPLSDDDAEIVRLATVYLHALVEELLRTMGRRHLVEAPAATLAEVPLVGSKSKKQAEKFYLSDLAEFRGLTVDAVIEKSVDEYLARMSFNTVADFDKFLKMLNVDPEQFRIVKPVLAKLMARRHQIAHSLDVSPDRDAPELMDRQRIGELLVFDSAARLCINLFINYHPREKKQTSIPFLDSLREQYRSKVAQLVDEYELNGLLLPEISS